MKFLFHLTRGTEWQDVSHDENLACACELTRTYGGTAEEVILPPRTNVGEPDSPFESRVLEERAVVIETTLDALAYWASDHGECAIHLVACGRWQDSSAGCIMFRIFITEPSETQGWGGHYYSP